jgi:uncharacterized protein (UPF0332 family)
MTERYTEEIAANLRRAEQSIQAAGELARGGYFDFAASRAYYGAFYAATAVLLHERFGFKKHSGVIAAIHQKFVKTGKLDKQLGRDLNWLFELRDVGDYGVTLHVQQEDAEKAIKAAEVFLDAIKHIIGSE